MSSLLTRAFSLVSVILAVALPAQVALAQCPPSFAAAPAFAAGGAPNSVAVGDFNADGRPDLAVANRNSNNISILFGNMGGTFQPPINFAAGNQPSFVAVGDFNGDGRLDLAVANFGGNTVSILRGNANGTFQARVNYATGSGPASVAVGDFNADGRPDLAVANSLSNTVSILLGNANGAFQTAVNYAVGTEPTSIAVGDFNADGLPDLAVANYTSNTVAILRNSTNGTFQGAVNYAVGTGPNSVAVGDFNADGRPDLAVANNGGGNVSILLGNASGTFQPRVNYASVFSPNAVAVGDFNGDGRLDLAVVNANPSAGDGDVSILLGNANGTFQTRVNYVTAMSARSVAVGDFNADGRPDLAVANSQGNTVSILLAKANGGFQVAASYDAGNIPYSIAVGDFNADGRPDLAVADAQSGFGGTIRILLGNAPPNAGTFQAEGFATTGGTSPRSVAVGDFNADGRPDLAVANYGSNTVAILLGNTNGTFPQNPANYVVGIGPVSVAVGDFNADGRPDLAVANNNLSGSGTVSILLGNAPPNAGTFQPAVNYAVGTRPTSVAVGDFNADGRPDLAVANELGGGVSILLGDGGGGGTFQAAVNYDAGFNPKSVAVGDFNADGRPDLAVANNNGSNVSILLGNANGTFQPRVNYASGNQPTSVAVGDFNADGQPDLAVASFGSIDISILLGNTDGTFQARIIYGVGGGPRFVAVGDFNSDGRPDLAAATDNGFNNVSVLLNTSTCPPAARRPVLILPGIAGSFVPEGSSAEVVRTWLMTLGSLPGTMVLDPIARSYDDLVESLRDKGYVFGQTLYPVPYDWRLPLAPLDGVIDGRLSAVTADGVSDESFATCVDYLGQRLKSIQIDYRNRTGQTLDAVDVVAHSMGGLVARAYIQSAAYGQTTSDGVPLPKIRNLITLGTPHRGASKAVNPWNNNWESEQAYKYVLSAFVGFADQKLFDGRALIGPGSLHRTRSSFFASDSREASTAIEQLAFMRSYGDGLANLLPTYLVELGSDGVLRDILGEAVNRNHQLIDLNGGATASASSGGLSLDPLLRWRIIVGTGEPTLSLIRRDSGWVFPDRAELVFEYRNNFFYRPQGPNETTTVDLPNPTLPNAGDGTVPAVSSEMFFFGDTRLLSDDTRQSPFPAGKMQLIRLPGVDHQALASNLDVQRRILSELLDVPESAISPQSISTSLARGTANSLSKFLGATSHDPISAVTVDGQGRRTGWTPQTGRLSEIPGSVYFGGDDGFAWFFAPVSTPITVAAQSLGQPYAFAFAIEQNGRRYSGSASGSLSSGAPISVPISVACVGIACACNASDIAGPNQSPGPDGVLTADDIIVFLGWFFASDPRANIAGPNQSTIPDNNFTADDIIVFLGLYFAGC